MSDPTRVSRAPTTAEPAIAQQNKAAQFAYATASFLFLLSTDVSAHVKWFTEQSDMPSVIQFSLGDASVQIGTLILLLAIGAGIVLNHFMFDAPRALRKFGQQHQSRIIYLVQFLVGLAMLVTAYNGNIIAPHLESDSSLMLSLRLLEAIAAIMLMANLAVPAAAALMGVLFIGCSQVFGLITPMEYCNLLGLAIFLAIMQSKETSRLAQYRQWALPLLRVITGTALIVLAFTEKLLKPDLALGLLSEFNMNFMKVIGIEAYTDSLFVLSAGLAEVLFGVILLLGVMTRTTIIALASFMIASNTYFFAIGDHANGVTEIFGHMPIFAAAIIFIIYGAGEKLRVPDFKGVKIVGKQQMPAH